MHVLIFRDMIWWLCCIYWHFVQLINCFWFHCLEKIVFDGSTKNYISVKKVYSLCLSFLKSDKFIHVYHLICSYLYIKYSFQAACEQSSSLHVSQAIALKTKLLSHFLYIFIHMLMAQIVLLCCTSYCIHLGSRWHMPINPRK